MWRRLPGLNNPGAGNHGYETWTPDFNELVETIFPGDRSRAAVRRARKHYEAEEARRLAPHTADGNICFCCTHCRLRSEVNILTSTEPEANTSHCAAGVLETIHNAVRPAVHEISRNSKYRIELLLDAHDRFGNEEDIEMPSAQTEDVAPPTPEPVIDMPQFGPMTKMEWEASKPVYGPKTKADTEASYAKEKETGVVPAVGAIPVVDLAVAVAKATKKPIVNRRGKRKSLSCKVVALVQLRFGPRPTRDRANESSIRRYAMDKMTLMKIPELEQARVINDIVALSFIPPVTALESEYIGVAARRIDRSEYASKRAWWFDPFRTWSPEKPGLI